MKRMTDHLATENPGMPERSIWEQVCDKYYGPDRDELLEGLTEEQVLGRIRRIRRRYYGGDIHGIVEVPPFSKVRDSAIPSFAFISSPPIPIPTHHRTEFSAGHIQHLRSCCCTTVCPFSLMGLSGPYRGVPSVRDPH
jgi:hypothetical protein